VAGRDRRFAGLWWLAPHAGWSGGLKTTKHAEHIVLQAQKHQKSLFFLMQTLPITKSYDVLGLQKNNNKKQLYPSSLHISIINDSAHDGCAHPRWHRQ
jgi:hypothetical protein